MAENYEISLGIGLDNSDFSNIQNQIKSLENDSVKIKLDTKDADNKIDNLKKQLQDLGNTKGKNKQLNLFDTTELTKSLNEVFKLIKNISRTMGTLNTKKQTSIVTTINHIEKSLSSATTKLEKLNKSLNVLNGKDIKIDFKFSGLSGNNNVQRMTKYGQEVARTVVPELRKQILYLENEINRKSKNAIQNYFLNQYKDFEGQSFAKNIRTKALFGTDSDNKGITDNKRMLAAEEYIGYLKEIASLNKVNLSGFDDQFSKSATEIINDTTKIQDGTKEVEKNVERLKKVFGNGIDTESLTSIVNDLRLIREAIESLSQNNSIDGLTASFNRLSETLKELMSNATAVKKILDGSLTGANTGIEAKDIVPNSSEAVKAAKQAGETIGKAVTDGVKKNLDIDNVIDKEVLKLMTSQGVAGNKNSQAFKDIRKAFVDYRDEQLGKEIKSDSIYGSYSTASGIDKLTAALANHKRVSDATLESRKQLDDEIKKSNKKAKEGYKIRISDDAVSELGDDFKTLRKSLGNAFTGSGKGTVSFLEYIDQHDISGVIDATKDEAEMIRQLVKMRQSIKNESKGIFTDSDLIDRREISIDDVRLDATAALEAIENAEQKMAQSSTQSANTIVQNQQRIQQSYEDTLAKQKQRLTEIDKEIGDYNERIIDPNVSFDDGQKYMAKMDTLEQEKAEILANIEKIDSAFKKNENILNSFKQSLSNIGMGADEIDEVANKISNLCVQIETLNQKKSTRMIKTDDGVFEKEVLDVDISGVDKYGNAIKFTQQYDMATADLIKSIEKVSTVQQKAGSATDTFAKKQKNAVANLTNQINQSYKASLSKNVNKPINKDSNIEKIKEKYAEVTTAIEKMGAASSDTFDDERNKVKALIDDFKALVKETRNLEHTSSKMKGNSVETQIAIAKQDFDKLKAEAKGYSVDFSKLDDLDISNITEKADVDKFTEALRIARAELNKLKAEVSSDKRINTAENNNKILSNKINDLKRDIENLPKIDLKINDFETDVNGATISVESLLNSLKEVNTRSDFNAVKSNFSSFKKAAEAAGIVVTEVARKMKSVDDIKLNMELGTYDNQLSQMYDKLDRLSGASKDLRDGIEQVENAYREMNSALKGTGDEVADRERLVQAEKDYAAALEKTNNLIKIQSRAEAKDARNQRLIDDREVFQAKIDAWLTKNSAATKKFGAQLLDLRAKAETADRVELNHLEKELQKVDKAADKAGLKMMSVGDKIKSKAKEYMAYFSVAEIFMEVTQAMKNMFEQVKLIDSAMTELKKVTDESDATYDKFLTNAASRAKDIGTTIDGLVSSTADFARLGYGFEDAQGLAEVANIYAVVGDEIEGVEGATESLISTMAAFKDEANGMSESDFAMSIIDRFNEIGNNFSISSGGIGEALERSASSLDAANNTIDESIALITASNQVVQDPATVGQALKTISMRIRGAKTE